MKILTPVLMVNEIEPSIPVWEALGFVKTMEVPQGGRLGFVGLASGSIQIMYQTRESVIKDVPELADFPVSEAALFIEVDDIEAVAAALGDTEYVVARRMTFYGADEIIVREPGGNLVTFAKMSGEEPGN